MAQRKQLLKRNSFILIKGNPYSLRGRKLKNGNFTLYLDFYEKGKKRKLEYLHLYFVPETDEAAKIMNNNTERAAKKIMNDRTNEHLAGKTNIKIIGDASEKIKLLDFIKAYAQEKGRRGDVRSKSYNNNVKNMCNYLERFENNTYLVDVDKDFISDFIHYLHDCGRVKVSPKTGKEIKHNKPLSQKTIANYIGVLRSVMKKAEIDKGISNPFKRLSNEDKQLFVAPKSNRTYLTIEEVKMLADNNILENEQTKQAFMFACFTGLRLSDIRTFKWSEIRIQNGMWVRDFKQQKTNERLVLPISEEARKWMPKKIDGTDDIFYKLPKANCELNRQIHKWVTDAGIEKYVTFHTSRHTFATMLLTKDVNIYTVSKLLGHTNIETTKIYAELIDKKKEEGVNALNGVLD